MVVFLGVRIVFIFFFLEGLRLKEKGFLCIKFFFRRCRVGGTEELGEVCFGVLVLYLVSCKFFITVVVFRSFKLFFRVYSGEKGGRCRKV